MTMTERINTMKAEIINKLQATNITTFILNKSTNVAVVTAHDKNLDENTQFTLEFDIFTVNVTGITKLADIILNFEKFKRNHDNKLDDLHRFDRDFIQTGLATREQKEKFRRDFIELLHEDPFEDDEEVA